MKTQFIPEVILTIDVADKSLVPQGYDAFENQDGSFYYLEIVTTDPQETELQAELWIKEAFNKRGEQASHGEIKKIYVPE